jgi:hypothetical protein
LKLENEPLESIGAKRIFDMPILKGFEKIELDFKALPNSVGTGDASAIAFEQDGEWKWVSLSTYADSLDEDWQHLSIPLSDFVGLDTEKTVSNLTLRFWNYEKGEYYFDNIALTGQAQTSIARPEDLSGIAISESEISLSWLGNSSKYNIYQDNVLIGNTEITSYRVTNLEANTDYDFYVTAVNEGNESAPSNQCVVKTFENQVLPPLQSYIISNFDDQSLDGWTGEGSLIPSISDGFFLRLSNPENGAAGIDRVFDAAVAKGYQYLEFDINTNGTYFYDEAAQVCFDQNGWMPVSIMNYIDGRSSEWQHVKIPLSAFTGLDADAAIARMSFRFWDSMPGTIDIDNIAFN